MAITIEGINVPDSKLARDITVTFDPDLLYAGAMFRDMGLTKKHTSPNERFEVDGANVARDFLRVRGISQQDIDTVWTAIALHTTPGVPQHMNPVIALLTAGVEMDVLGMAYSELSDAEREAVVQVHPCSDFISGLLRRHQAQATDHFWQREGRCYRRQGSAISPYKFLRCHPRLRLARMTTWTPMARENPRSTVRIAKHPIHPILVPFPIVCFVGTLLADLTNRPLAHLRERASQSQRLEFRAGKRRLVDCRQRARRSRPQPRARLYDIGEGRRLLLLALQLLGPVSRSSRPAATCGLGRESDRSRLFAELARGASGARLLHGGQPPLEIRRRRLRRRTWQLGPVGVQRLQGRFRAVQRRASER
jgi:hypothetical protein